MGIFARVSDVIASNINYLLDRAEDPEKMIKHIIREMEEKIGEVRTGVAKSIAGEKRLKRELEKNQKESAEWETRAISAVEKGRDDLAREALKRKQEHDDLVASLDPQWHHALKTADRLKQNLRALEAKVSEARRRRDHLIARQRAAETEKEIAGTMANLGDASNAFGKFDRMERKVEDLEAEAAAASEMASEEHDLEAAFAEMEDESSVDDALAALKERMAAGARP